MDLSRILSITGKPGLFRILTQSKGGVVVESLLDGRRMAIGQTQRVSTLSDISIYTTEGDVPIKDIFAKIAEHTKGAAIDVDMNNNDALRSFFTEMVPTHDEDRVYVSDIRKMVKWFNTLQGKNLLIEVAVDEVAVDEVPAAPNTPDVEAETVDVSTSAADDSDSKPE